MGRKARKRSSSGMYQVETKRLNQRVKRNTARFPENFCFQLTRDEYDNLRSQIATSSEEYGVRRYLPYVFTEQGIAMLFERISAVELKQLALQKKTNAFHDRFIVLDDKTVYHIGASIKDAGKKCFGITLIQDDTMANDLISRLKKIR